jgi:hypothetical protein
MFKLPVMVVVKALICAMHNGRTLDEIDTLLLIETRHMKDFKSATTIAVLSAHDTSSSGAFNQSPNAKRAGHTR